MQRAASSGAIGVAQLQVAVMQETTRDRHSPRCKHWHHRADRRARPGGRTSAFAGRCCAACNTMPNRQLSGRKGELALRCAVRALACDARLSLLAARGTALDARVRFALPMRAAAARARCALHFDPRVHRCTTRRAAPAPVTVRVLRRLPLSPPDRRAPEAHPSARRAPGGMGREAGGWRV